MIGLRDTGKQQKELQQHLLDPPKNMAQTQADQKKIKNEVDKQEMKIIGQSQQLMQPLLDPREEGRQSIEPGGTGYVKTEQK